MAKAVIQANIQTSNGVISVAPNASIAIRDADSGSLVSLWSDRDGVSAIANPTQADENGDFKVYANYGRVNITATLGASTKTWSDVVIFDEADKFYPNDIINGNFKVAQAGTSFAAAANAAYDLDGWYNVNVSSAVFTVAQVAGSSTGKFARRVTVTTADASVAAGDRVAHITRIEGYDCVKYLNSTFTLGFWVKSTVIGIHCVSIANGTSNYVAEYTINIANTWEYKTITITGGTPLLNSTTTGFGIAIVWTNLAGTDYQGAAGVWGLASATANQVNDFATVGNIFELQDVTLNLGTSVAAIEPSYDQELARCQRYYRRVYPEVAGTPFFAAYVSTTTVADGIYHLNPPMRDAPTAIEHSGTATDYAVAFAAVATQCSAVPTFLDATKNHIRVRFTVAAGLTAGQAGFLRTDSVSVAGYLAWSSRL